jgi:hypothetical protein
MEGQFKKGFFEFIAAADAEKVHSQTIGWMFSPASKALTTKQKMHILSGFFDCNELELADFEVDEVFVEYKDIDILIVCKSVVIVIENKIKSTQHSDQLNKYERIISEINGFNSKLYKPKFIYLTLFGESANNRNWKDLNYSKLYDIIVSNSSKHSDSSEFDVQEQYILKSYLKTINQLTSALDWIENDYQVREWVFQNGDFAKSNVYNYNFSDKNSRIKYLAETGLVRFIQKYYYKKVIDYLDSQLPMNAAFYYESSSRNGGGLIQITFEDLAFTIDQEKYNIGYQIQGDSEKYNVANVKYASSGETELNKMKQIVNLKTELEGLKNTFKFTRRNPGQSKPYASISNKLNVDLIYCSPKELADYIIEVTSNRYNNLVEFKNRISQ